MKPKKPAPPQAKDPARKKSGPRATEDNVAVARCLCGTVEIEIRVPAFWAWHDHSTTAQRAHGAAYATYVGCWKSKVRVTKGLASITTYEQQSEQRRRSFCRSCGTPLMYERGTAPRMVNIPRALFSARTGREALYHVAWPQSPEWAYRGEALGPVKAYPGLLKARPRKKEPGWT